jgi:hypothetical protein
MSGSPEEPFELGPDPAPEFPSYIWAAGVMWMVLGALFVLMTCGGVVAAIVIQLRQPGPARAQPFLGCGALPGLIIGCGFFIAGRRLVRGSIVDPVTPSLFSILLGLFYLVVGVMGVRASDNIVAKVPEGYARAVLISGIVCAVFGGMFLLPSALALAARAQYLEWRGADEDEDEEPPRSPKPRRLKTRRWEDDESDRPWQRGRR